ncbi:serine/threonine-protein phosphatase PGAM5, mitochondrial-like isoform X2 [Anoplophora glabripennis]|uniref:serine/threonine-protein phosphatase PGAM5, mitochondrial-like isoform X2 n=1 Tax=Anoplophora glabripennis TaxID=217634 RepID=UPI000873F951|nr:serine/threonine-protein phosphatase PGAM5, mitochondrial-like isoform X2 [Anoplophora glabripennis]
MKMSFSKTHKILLGLSAVSGVATFYCLNNQKNKAHASWTTSYSVSAFAKWDENWDHRSPKYTRNPKQITNEKDENLVNEERENLRPKFYRHLILIRHGQYNLQGETDRERILTKLGRLQAEYTGKRLKELNLPYTIMVKSTMARALETGSIISQSLPDLPVTECDLLREGAPIPPEPPLGRYKPEAYFYQDGSRIEAAFRKYFHRADPTQTEDTYTVLVCHANVIRYFVCRALQFPAEAWLRLSLNHASITWITITPSGRCVLRALGDTGYMSPDIITST